MKKSILSAFLVMSICAFTDSSINVPNSISDPQFQSNLHPKEAPTTKEGFFYVRFAAAENNLTYLTSIVPGLGLGYRRLSGDGAADISITGLGHKENKSARFFWTAPKASYLYYLQPDAKASTYLGAGLAWGGLSSKGQNFVGLIPSFTLGFEFAHRASFLGFGEFTISQPALSVTRKGAFPGPIAELSMGIGF